MRAPFWLDANALIEAKRRWYKFDMVPKFWMILSEEIQSGQVRCAKQVYDELTEGNDQLAEWVKNRKSSLCSVASSEVQAELRLIADYLVMAYPPRQVQEFLTGADVWLIAFARHHGGTVVTGELNKRKSKIRVPVICKQFAVPFTDLPGMLDHFGKLLY